MSAATSTVMMLLTDGRFPSGGHAYSAGMEQAVTWGDVFDLTSAEAFATGRVATAATMGAQVTAVAHLVEAGLFPEPQVRLAFDRLDAELDARTASFAARDVSRQQARRWLRAIKGAWPDLLDERGTCPPASPLQGRHGWVVLGAATARLGLSGGEAATVALYELVGTPLWAAVRLLGLDPMAASAVVARLATRFEPTVRAAAAEAAEVCRARFNGDAAAMAGESGGLSWISCGTAPLSDLAAEAHLGREERLFAS